MNIINQSVIGAKEGIVEAVSKLVGSDITDAILCTADGSDFKSIDDYTLYEVLKVAIDGADRPTTNRKKVSVNMELMQSNAARVATYGIVIGIPQLTLTLLANFETATKYLLVHAHHLQEVRIQSCARCNVAPNHFNGARGSRQGEGPTRCICTKRRNSTFSCQFGIIPQFYDAKQQHRLRIYQISLRR